jgi:hypothetical protein
MSSREERIDAEAAALWRELYDESPPDGAEGGEMIDLMLSRLPALGYERMRRPFLRPLTWPKRRPKTES